jgi:hypothetical protein
LRSHFFEPFVNCRRVKQHALDIALHQSK